MAKLTEEERAKRMEVKFQAFSKAFAEKIGIAVDALNDFQRGRELNFSQQDSPGKLPPEATSNAVETPESETPDEPEVTP